jgi:hypothetical protein
MICGRKKKFWILVAVCVVYVAFLAGLMEHRARGELVQARDRKERGDLEAANRHYFQALNWYAPWGSSITAADELMALALDNLAAGRKSEAYHSLLRLRSALLADRSFFVPRLDLVELSGNIIALYLAESKLGAEAGQEAIIAQSRIYAELYSTRNLPQQRWLFLAVAGFLLWVAASFWFIKVFFGANFTAKISYRFKKAVMPISLFVGSYVLWIYSMSIG